MNKKVITICDDKGVELLTTVLFDEVVIELIISLVLYHKIPKQHLVDICERYDIIQSVLPRKG